eukprot:CAMPEP_0198144368 /NCGR_PEP_ID=MMETSP1443-20131203/15053_1 /TAXON_ID=186043 /ORGANISM="Entomoneis sp., Strain CCMP2396" /LENGTH=420 /DNA_ID=CAMNT_0043807751 /DNA_START=207 /DNA_END=1466 /DNA_ORIENTATION=+
MGVGTRISPIVLLFTFLCWADFLSSCLIQAWTLPLQTSLRRPVAHGSGWSQKVSAASAAAATVSLKKTTTISTSALFNSPDNNDSDREWQEDSNLSRDPNRWRSASDDSRPDWMDVVESKKDGSFWTTFEPASEDSDDTSSSSLAVGDNGGTAENISSADQEEANANAWLDTLAALSAEEVEYNQKEADRADMARQMEEWNFSPEIIASTLGVATNAELEQVNQDMQAYMDSSYEAEIDMETVESHTTVDIEKETGEPIRTQMVYVDEHTCIGCTNCAMIAQSTFFMDAEHGRARVFQQWGDDDETIQVAIETCPVDCIHYIPYDELKRLEVDRRDQNINFKARLVNQGDYSRVGGSSFTAPQQISGNMSSRCSNCPTRGCKNCPMYGVGKNPEFEKKEAQRKERIERSRLKREREAQQK